MGADTVQFANLERGQVALPCIPPTRAGGTRQMLSCSRLCLLSREAATRTRASMGLEGGTVAARARSIFSSRTSSRPASSRRAMSFIAYRSCCCSARHLPPPPVHVGTRTRGCGVILGLPWEVVSIFIRGPHAGGQALHVPRQAHCCHHPPVGLTFPASLVARQSLVGIIDPDQIVALEMI